MSKDFKFHIPIELVKSDKADDDSPDSWKIQGIASTQDKDLQGEDVIQEGLDVSVLKAGRGLFNNDHLKGPENVLGQIDDAEFVEHNGKKALLVKGYLFKHQERAKAYYNIMRSIRKGAQSRVHFSIEGKVLERDYANTATIKKASITKVALTLDPVNPFTYADLVKSLYLEEHEQPDPSKVKIKDAPSPNVKKGTESLEMTDHEIIADKMREQMKELQDDIIKAMSEYFKSLSAGAGYADAPATRTGGAALQTESLDSKPKSVTYKKDKKKKKVTQRMIKSVIDSVRQALPSADPIRLSTLVIQRIEQKLKGEPND